MICSHDFLILIVHYCFFHRENPIEIEREREHEIGHHTQMGRGAHTDVPMRKFQNAP